VSDRRIDPLVVDRRILTSHSFSSTPPATSAHGQVWKRPGAVEVFRIADNANACALTDRAWARTGTVSESRGARNLVVASLTPEGPICSRLRVIDSGEEIGTHADPACDDHEEHAIDEPRPPHLGLLF
jgi:hypothetical protein